jgi:hypothetical protein
LSENCSAIRELGVSAERGVMPSEPPVISRSATMVRRTTSLSASVTSAK